MLTCHVHRPYTVVRTRATVRGAAVRGFAGCALALTRVHPSLQADQNLVLVWFCLAWR